MRTPEVVEAARNYILKNENVVDAILELCRTIDDATERIVTILDDIDTAVRLIE